MFSIFKLLFVSMMLGAILGCGPFEQMIRSKPKIPVPTAGSSAPVPVSMIKWGASPGGASESAQGSRDDTIAPTPSRSTVEPTACAIEGTSSLKGVETAAIQAVSFDPAVMDPVIRGDETLEDLLALAFANNPAIKELAASTRIAGNLRTQVGLYANPLIGYQGQQLADAGTDQHLLFVQQQIITGNKLALNRAVLNESVRVQIQELEAQKLRVATDIKLGFYDSLRLQMQIAAIDQFTELLQQGVQAAEKRVESGEASRIELLQTQVQLKQLELERKQRNALLNAKLREITVIAGVPSLQLERVDGTLPETPVDHDWKCLEESFVASSPEYAAAQARIHRASIAIRRQESQPLPNLGVQIGAGVDNGTNSGMMNLQIAAPLPVFNQNQGNIAAAHAEYCRALQEAQRIDHSIRARLAVASGEYVRAAESVNMFQDSILPAARETLELAESAYRAGEEDFIQLLVSRRTFFDANLAFISARGELAAVQSRMDGFLLTGALEPVSNVGGDDALRSQALDQE